MIDLSILNEPQLARIYLVANTPAYLYRNYRADPSVWEIARRHTVDDLVSFAVEHANERKLKDVVFAYAALVALSFKDQREVLDRTANVSFENLDWGRKLLELGRHEQTGNVKIEITVPPRIEQQPSTTSSSANTGTLSIEVR
jgi:hypothetical protein